MTRSHPLQELTVPAYVPNDAKLLGGKGEQIAGLQDEANNCTFHATALDGCEGPKILIMTGPNYSGKSIYLKMVNISLSALHRRSQAYGWRWHSSSTWPISGGKASRTLSHRILELEFTTIISFVPAENAKIGLTDKILTRITTRESISKV